MSFQQIATFFGESGCYFDSIIQAGEDISGNKVDRLRYYSRAKEMKSYLPNGQVITWILANCYVNSPDDILQDLTSRPWKFRKESATYKAKPGEIEILRYDWSPKPGTTLGHFVLGDGNGEVKYDPMGDNSPVVKYGVLASKRIFTEVK